MIIKSAGESISRILRLLKTIPSKPSTDRKHGTCIVSCVSGVNPARITGTPRAQFPSRPDLVGGEFRIANEAAGAEVSGRLSTQNSRGAVAALGKIENLKPCKPGQSVNRVASLFGTPVLRLLAGGFATLPFPSRNPGGLRAATENEK
jgi:hypothetical protein